MRGSTKNIANWLATFAMIEVGTSSQCVATAASLFPCRRRRGSSIARFQHFHKQSTAYYWIDTGTYRIMCPQNADDPPLECRKSARKAPRRCRGNLGLPQGGISAF